MVYYLFIVCLKRPVPNPIRRLKRGPAIEPATPISPYPILARAQFRVKSAIDNKYLLQSFPLPKE